MNYIRNLWIIIVKRYYIKKKNELNTQEKINHIKEMCVKNNIS